MTKPHTSKFSEFLFMTSTICCRLMIQYFVGVPRHGSVLNGVTGRHHATLCPSSLQTVTIGGINPQDSFLTVLDVECVDTKVRYTKAQGGTLIPALALCAPTHAVPYSLP